ncbi:MAG: pitrilysin family protein, partial [Gemmatimonadales bacterium]
MAFFSVASAVPASSQLPDPGTTLPVDSAVTIGTLQNGLRYYIRTNQRPENRAELRLIVNAGSVLEDDDQRGLAHVVEHMAFNGTENFAKQAIVDYLESIGMRFGPDINAFTSFDETVYMLTVPTDDATMLEMGFQILEEWAHRQTLEPEEIELERGVVIEEWRRGRGAEARMRDAQFPTLFADSKYAERLPIGTVEVLEGFDRERLQSFYDMWYRPDLMAVVAVGDFNGDSVQQLIHRYFAAIPVATNPRPRDNFEVPQHDETLFAIASDPEASNSRVSLYHKQPVRDQSTYRAYRQRLVEVLYNAMFNNRLSELAQSAEPPFIAGFSTQGQFVRTSEVYFLAALVAPGGIEIGLEALVTEAKRVAQFGFTEAELDRTKADVLRSMEQVYADRNTRDSRLLAAEYRRSFLTGEPIPGIETELELHRLFLPRITLDDVDRLAGEWLTEHSR